VLRIAELAAEVGFPAGAINIVPADGPTNRLLPGQAPRALTRSRSPARRGRGSEIMRLCSEPIKRLTLELGGKSPAIVFADAKPRGTPIPSSVWSIYLRPPARAARRAPRVARRGLDLRRLRRAPSPRRRSSSGSATRSTPRRRSARSSRRRTATRVHGYVEKGREEGAEVVLGGRGPGTGAGAFYLPTVLAGVESSMTVAQEEIFGPVVTAIPFRGREGRDSDRETTSSTACFATGLDGRSGPRPSRRARAIKSGMVGINMPFQPRSRASRSGVTSSRASAASSRSTRSTSISRRKACSSPRAPSPSTRSGSKTGGSHRYGFVTSGATRPRAS